VQACSSERYSNVYGRLLQPPVKIEYVCTNSGTHLTKPPTSPKTRVRAQVQRDIWVHPSMNRSTYVKEFLENNIYKGIRNCWNVSAVFRWRCGHAARDTPGGGGGGVAAPGRTKWLIATQVYLPGALNGRIRPQKWKAMLIGYVESFFIIRVILMPAGKGISLPTYGKGPFLPPRVTM
jgi:hypothetical protein